ncbi:MAG: hypothetical protein O7A68_06505 [Alphaproteobacteria bacterium]|nr:hypothetical protein [Alphaproteobacteria bacterium]
MAESDTASTEDTRPESLTAPRRRATRGPPPGRDAGAPTLGVAAASGAEDSAIALDISSALACGGGFESLTVTVSGVPAGARLSAGRDNGDGSWSLSAGDLDGLAITPPADPGADFTLTVTVTTSEAGGDTATTGAGLQVTVAGVAEGRPSRGVSETSNAVRSAIALHVSTALADPDGSERLTVTVAGVPSGAVLSAVAGEDFSLAVTATASEGGGDVVSTTATLDVTVSGGGGQGGGAFVFAEGGDRDRFFGPNAWTDTIHLEASDGGPVGAG